MPMKTVSNLLQRANAFFSMYFSESGSLIVVNPIQLRNAPSLIFVK